MKTNTSTRSAAVPPAGARPRREILPMERMLNLMTMSGLTRKLRIIDATSAAVCLLAAPVFFTLGKATWGWMALAAGIFSAITCYFEPYKLWLQFLKVRFVRK